MKIGEFTFRIKDKGFIQPEPAPVNPGGVAAFVPEESRPLPHPMLDLPGRVATTYLEGNDSAVWIENAGNRGPEKYTVQPKSLPYVNFSSLQPITIMRRRPGIFHTDVQGRLQAANTLLESSFFAHGYGARTATHGSATPSKPGGGPSIQRPGVRLPFVLQTPRASTLPQQLQAQPVNVRPAVRGNRASWLSDPFSAPGPQTS